MGKSPAPRPTDAELAILRVLWEKGPSTVRQVHELLAAERETGYTTTLKLLQIMMDKGLVGREASERSHVYHAAVSQQQTRRRLMSDLLRTAFDGSMHKLVMHALAAKKASPQELEAIRKLLNDIERGKP